MHIMLFEFSLFNSPILHCVLVVAMHLVVFELTNEMVMGRDVTTMTVQCILIAELSIVQHIRLVFIVIPAHSSNLGVMVIAFHFNDFFNGRYPEVLTEFEFIIFYQLLHVYSLLFEPFYEEWIRFFDVKQVNEWPVKDFLKNLDLVLLRPKLMDIYVPVLQF